MDEINHQVGSDLVAIVSIATGVKALYSSARGLLSAAVKSVGKLSSNLSKLIARYTKEGYEIVEEGGKYFAKKGNTLIELGEGAAKGGLDDILKRFNSLTQPELKSLYIQLAKTEVQGTSTIVNQADVLAEILANKSLINPYSFSHQIEDIILTQDAIFVRAYNQSSVGKWMVSIEDMKSFTSVDDFINKTALPIVESGTGNLVRPTNVSIVKIPQGTVIRKSVARPQDWGGQGHLSGGNLQYEIRNFNYNMMKEWYKDLGNISDYLK
jgi:hypothetical protein